MSINVEISQLKEALKGSPENVMIRKLLVNKMKSISSYNVETENILKESIALFPNELEFKGSLIELYFKQDKYSASTIIAEEVYNISLFDVPTRIYLTKCYLRLNDKSRSLEIYESIINENPDFKDDDLDNEFRAPAIELEENLSNDNRFLEKPNVSFKDVGGMQNVKNEIDLKIIKPLENQELFAKYGKKIGGGILLYGPPGCGKTFISKATAGEINANFINVGLNDILDMWLGNSEKNIHNYFELARSSTPCVLFFDEIDALGAKRDDLRGSAGKNVINQFLAELDGIKSNNDGILIVGATNSPWQIDSAFLRPGRFDRIIFVPPPDNESKVQILKLKLKDKPTSDIDYLKVVKHTKDYSGADLEALVDIATERVLEKVIKTGKENPIVTNDLLHALKQHNPSTIQWFSTARNYAEFANKSGLYDEVKKYLGSSF